MRRVLLLIAVLAVAAPSASAAETRDITIAVSGDMLVHEAVWRQAAAYADGDGYDFRPMMRRVRPLIAGADLAFCHVETPLTARTTAPTAFPVFSTPPALATAIRRAGFDACSTASNHSLDQGPAGVAATLRALDASHVRHAGSARSAREARRPLILETASGVRVALLAFTQVTNGQVPDPAWRVNDIGSDARPILAQARQARRLGADVVVVNLHWGVELQHEPTGEQAALARKLGSSGLITAIVGQHAHVVQPIRRAGGALVLFGEGNLLSGQAKAAEFGLPAETQDGLIGLLRIRVPATGPATLRRIDYAPIYVDHADYVVVPVGADRSKPEYEASLARTTAAIGHGPHFGAWRRMTP
jgi:poly-gamma-glutamate synthesis protein (capsule biosynthesis protein)